MVSLHVGLLSRSRQLAQKGVFNPGMPYAVYRVSLGLLVAMLAFIPSYSQSQEQAESAAQVAAILEKLGELSLPTLVQPALQKLRNKEPRLALRQIQSEMVILREGSRASHSRRAILPALQLVRGLSELALGNKGQAKTALERSLKLSPGNPLAAYFLTEILIANGKHEQAIAVLDEALWFWRTAPPKKEALRFRLAEIYLALEKKEQADKALAEILKESPSYVPAHRLLGDFALRDGKRDEALKHFEQVSKAKPEDLNARFSLIRALLLFDDDPLDQSELERALSIAKNLKPSDTELSSEEKRQGQALLSQAYMKLGKIELAEKQLTLAKKSYPNDPEIEKLIQQLQIDKRAVAQEGAKSTDSAT